MKMINDYAIEVKEFPKEWQKFIITFDGYYAHFGATPNRRIVTCSIIENPSKKIYAGSAIKNPNDLGYDEWIGRRWAFKRAVLNLYMIWNLQKKTGIEFNKFWQYFRKALAENQIYLEERKGKNG